MKETNHNMLLPQYDINPYFVKVLNTPEEIEAIKNIPDAVLKTMLKEFNGNFEFYDDLKGVDLDENNSVVFATEEVFRKFLRCSELMGYKQTVYKADKLLFKNKFDLSHSKNQYFNTNSTDFCSMIKIFITKHFNVNDVLDKMNEGLKLTEYDYHILKST